MKRNLTYSLLYKTLLKYRNTILSLPSTTISVISFYLVVSLSVDLLHGYYNGWVQKIPIATRVKYVNRRNLTEHRIYSIPNCNGVASHFCKEICWRCGMWLCCHIRWMWNARVKNTFRRWNGVGGKVFLNNALCWILFRIISSKWLTWWIRRKGYQLYWTG